MNEASIRKRMLISIKSGSLKNKLKASKSSPLETKKYNDCEIDICLKNKNGKVIGIEIKADVGRDEIRKGIGQALEYLKYCNGSYLAVPSDKDGIKELLGKTPVGLIVYTKSNFEVVKSAKINNPKEKGLNKYFEEDYPHHRWQTFERNNHLDVIFDKYKEHSGKKKKTARYGFHFLMKALSKLIKEKLNKKELNKLEKFANYYSVTDKEVFKISNKLWFSYGEIKITTDEICKRSGEKKHTPQSIKWRLDESIRLGIIEFKYEGKNRFFRINPPMISFILKRSNFI